MKNLNFLFITPKFDISKFKKNVIAKIYFNHFNYKHILQC